MVVKRLMQKHDGQYLAKVTTNCLDQFGLAELVCLSFYLFCDPEHFAVALMYVWTMHQTVTGWPNIFHFMFRHSEAWPLMDSASRTLST